jgi:hypothetical protein
MPNSKHEIRNSYEIIMFQIWDFVLRV